jgi:aminoglycoside 3-N-acetyltransferase I
MSDQQFRILQLTSGNVEAFRQMLDLFGNEFEDTETYSDNQPTDSYIESLLSSDSFYAMVAAKDDKIIGGIAGYELQKFEQERSEFYIYDLAVAQVHRRSGIGTALVSAFGKVAKEHGAWTMYVQADPIDLPAVALYEKLGVREAVLHFDIIPR